MQERVFRPLGMTRTSMVWQDRFDSDYADGYDEYGRSLGPLKQRKAGAAGSMSTTISDFARFMQAVLEGRLLRPKTREQMLSPKFKSCQSICSQPSVRSPPTRTKPSG
jgi:CubicO group peptidase (beta-lactamase class C family)